MTAKILLNGKNLSKTYLSVFQALTVSQRIMNVRGKKSRSVFENINLVINRGESVCLQGENGSGKSTLLKCLAGVTSFSSGKVEIHGKLVSFLTHGFGAYEDRALWRIIILVQQLYGCSLKDAEQNVKEIAALGDLQEKLFIPVSQLSEGMRAKVSLFSLIFAKFDLLLMDESLNHIDQESRNRFHKITRQWITEGRSILFTSHETSLVDQFADRKLQLKNHNLIAT